MKKKIFFLLCLIILSFNINNIYAAVVSCTDEDFSTGEHGCKNKYEISIGNRGNVQKRTCTDADYATKDHGCSNTYSTTDDSTDNGGATYSSTGEVSCTDEDFSTGEHGCKNKYEISIGNRGNVQKRSCTDADYATKNHGCSNTYSATDIYSSTGDWWKDAGNFFSRIRCIN